MKINFKEILLIPNLISLFRLFLFIPFYYLLNNYFNDSIYRTAIIILIFVAFISDLLDGFVARKTNSISELGKIIDPLADKVLVALIVIRLFLLNEIPLFYFIIVITRDLLILIGGILISSKVRKVLPSNMLGKFTVFLIGIFILVTISALDRTQFIYKSILYISSLLCFASLLTYCIRAIKQIKTDDRANS
jgi:CDP-diacylglycerol--glycerol-3-phosphate 3-phosphatidyltransferase